MQTLLRKLLGKREIAYSTVIVTYLSENGMWRGFVMPYDLTYEADSRNKVIKVLQDMISSYRTALDEYDRPSHLTDVPLSYEEDQGKWEAISNDVINKLLNGVDRIQTSDYYVEAQVFS